MSAQGFMAAAAEAAITPPIGTPLVGPAQAATGVHDGLFARALVLGDGARRAAVVCLDLAGLDFALADEIRAAVERDAGICETWLCCTHTHSAPFTIPWSVTGFEWLQHDGKAWREELVAKVAEAVRRAAASVQEAALRAGRAPVRVGSNRRLPTKDGIVMKPNPRGTVVPWVDVLRVDDADGRPLAVLFSHAAHPVIVHGASTLVSADYPGYAAATVRKQLGGNVVAMFAQGCGANINGDPLAAGFEAAEHAGVMLGEAAVRAARDSVPIRASELRTASAMPTLPLQDFPTVQECQAALRASQERLARAEQARESDKALWHRRNEALCLQDRLEKARSGKAPCLEFELHALMLGDEWCLLALTHEVFAEYQLWADQASPFRHTMVLAYTNACESYVPTDVDLALGGYEAAAGGAALFYHHRSALKPGAERQLKEAISTLWE